MHGRRLSIKSKENKEIIRFTRNIIKLSTTNKTIIKNVQIRSQKISYMYKIKIKFCIFLYVKIIK